MTPVPEGPELFATLVDSEKSVVDEVLKAGDFSTPQFKRKRMLQ